MITLCIKTNNLDVINYILDKLNCLNLDSIYSSCHDFKLFTNIFIHYKGNKKDLFYSEISNILSVLIINIYEHKIIEKILQNEYFYFNITERNDILERYQRILLDEPNTLKTKKDFIISSLQNQIKSNKKLYLKGFITFRLKDYINELERIIDEAVNCYLIDKEYQDFINLLKLYVNSEESKINLVHLFYEKDNIKLFDENNNKITINTDLLNTKFLSDISFSYADMILNTLLNLMPKKIYIHLENNNKDEFITTLQKIFENRISIYK